MRGRRKERTCGQGRFVAAKGSLCDRIGASPKRTLHRLGVPSVQVVTNVDRLWIPSPEANSSPILDVTVMQDVIEHRRWSSLTELQLRLDSRCRKSASCLDGAAVWMLFGHRIIGLDFYTSTCRIWGMAASRDAAGDRGPRPWARPEVHARTRPQGLRAAGAPSIAESKVAELQTSTSPRTPF